MRKKVWLKIGLFLNQIKLKSEYILFLSILIIFVESFTYIVEGLNGQSTLYGMSELIEKGKFNFSIFYAFCIWSLIGFFILIFPRIQIK